MYYPEIPVLLSLLLTCYVDGFCWLVLKADLITWIKISLQLSRPSYCCKRNIVLKTKQGSFLTNFLIY